MGSGLLFDDELDEATPQAPKRRKPQDTLEEARQAVIEGRANGGIHCPCCTRWAKDNPRNINNTMALSLMWLVRESGPKRDWVDVPETAPRSIVRSNQLPTLRHWGLVERLPSETEKKKHSGLWRPTEKGVRFARGEITVPKFVVIFDGKVVRFSDDEEINIHDALKEKFDYEKLMSMEV